QLLGQARGEKVEVVLKTGGANVTGTVVGVDCDQPPPGKPNQPPPVTCSRATSYSVARRNVDGVVSVVLEGKDSAADAEVLNLWCADGLRPLRLRDIERVRFLNPVMEREIRRALEVLASSHDTGKKAVSLNFTGQGKRRVRVGYVVASPLWRTS